MDRHLQDLNRLHRQGDPAAGFRLAQALERSGQKARSEIVRGIAHANAKQIPEAVALLHRHARRFREALPTLCRILPPKIRAFCVSCGKPHKLDGKGRPIGPSGKPNSRIKRCKSCSARLSKVFAAARAHNAYQINWHTEMELPAGVVSVDSELVQTEKEDRDAFFERVTPRWAFAFCGRCGAKLGPERAERDAHECYPGYVPYLEERKSASPSTAEADGHHGSGSEQQDDSGDRPVPEADAPGPPSGGGPPDGEP